MRWEKRGQIFNFDTSDFGGEFISHAQSPQALVLGNVVRVFFSTRKQSANGKFLSHVQYVDFDHSFGAIVNSSHGQVIPLGAPGTFNEHGIFPFSPLRHGTAVYGYTTGWTRRVSVDVDSGIGLAVSRDNGTTFTALGDGPVVGASLHEPFLVCDGFVRVYDTVFHMWYIYGTGWSDVAEGVAPERTYVIGHATSADGILWNREGRQVVPTHHDQECQALPTVIKIGTRYHMYFCHRHTVDFRTNPANGYRLGYAWSDDLIHWTRDDAAAGISLSSDGWDSQMMCYPHLVECGGEVWLLYNGNAFGKHGFGLARLITKE